MADINELRVESLYNVKGWVCVVTGGGTGLGLMTAKALAANGAKVYITGRRAEKLKDAEMTDSASGGSIIGIGMDVTSKSSIAETVAAIAAKEPCVHLLVNNAGVSSVNYGPEGQPKGTPEEVAKKMWEFSDFGSWMDVYQVNVAACYFVSVAFIPLLCKVREVQGREQAGSIVNVSSLSGITKTSQNGQYSYNAAKAATISLTEQLAVDLAPPGVGIRVNTIAPGYFPSEMTPVGVDFEKNAEHFRTKWGTPFGRAGNARDYAQALMNFAVNGFVTGATLLIDGGYLLTHP